MDYKKYIQMIDEYLQEPNNINLEWVECLTVCRIGLERMRPKKPLDICTPVVTWGLCPTCKGELNKLGKSPNRVFINQKFCSDCGQALDWR